MLQKYYHISIETKETNKKGEKRSFYEWNQTNKEEIIDSIIIPYLQNDDFFVDGCVANKETITRLLVKESDRKIGEITKEANDNIPPNFLVILSDENIFENRTKNVTRDFINEAKLKIQKHRQDNKKEKKCNSNLDSLSKVFIVHGHDDLAKIEVARFVEKLGLDAIILSEQPNEGRTIIEKIENYADAGFAIVLYTPCDEGKAIGSPDLKKRARQNVVFEHGFFIGHLGRSRVHALKKGDVELPNDISGVVYTQMDEAMAWQFKVAKEMKKVGYNIDLNKL
ncbi:MAG: nucleotide-binding protein [Fibrobacter sp.]|nr:nucleotide-binding protein [Fibrobacter sp.]